jgi:hypothetical protein
MKLRKYIAVWTTVAYLVAACLTIAHVHRSDFSRSELAAGGASGVGCQNHAHSHPSTPDRDPAPASDHSGDDCVLCHFASMATLLLADAAPAQFESCDTHVIACEFRPVSSELRADSRPRAPPVLTSL